jgi:hypothetical protein
VSGTRELIITDAYPALFGRILFDDSITPSTRALILSENESLAGSHPDLAFRYQELFEAKTAMYQV